MFGCGAVEDSAKQTVLNSIDKNKEIKSMAYNGNIEVVNEEKVVSEFNQLMQILNNYKITFDGKLQQEPFHIETDMSILINIQGMDFVYEIPMIADESNLYIKVPSMLKTILPELKQDYLMMDISKLNQSEDNAEYKNDSIKLFSKIIDAVDEKYFIRNDIKSYSIDNGKVKDVITLNITQDSLESYIKNFVDSDGLTEIIIFLEKYSISDDMLNKLQQIKKEFDDDSQNIDQIVNDINGKLLINNFVITTVIDKDNFLRKIVFNIDINKIDDDINSLMVGQFDVNTINKGIQTDKQVPSLENVTNLDELDLSKFMNK